MLETYHSMIGSLLYLCASRPDIMLSVGMCDGFKPHQRKVTMWRSSESFDIWIIPQTLAYGTQEELTSSLKDSQILIGWETRWIGSPLPEGANFLVSLW